MTPRLVAVACLLALVASPLEASKGPEAPKPRIDGIEASCEEDRLQVSFRLADGLSDDVIERIQSGIEVRFNHRVDVLARRAVPLWMPKVVARARIATAVTYDPLTRRYEMTRDTELRFRGKLIGVPTSERRTTESIAEARSWMTEIAVVPSLEIPPVSGSDRLRVHVESTIGRRYVFYLFPARHIVSAERPLER